ncbi:MAG: hypothetical protein UIB63_09620 [Methanobrevibacter sp.]|uniref:hypothetical protein n=1 Tax=Methanobrevibacter sp. TaxID=66852 RepID=UPI002E790BD3|nr:hypothetical protein [Methanobrevibacter sp.]MEE0943352.1 hypothetical protein [Methanobrevibacter sp.]
MDETFVFKLLKILDNLQEYSKDSVIREYDLCDDEVSQIILNKSVYPNGDQLGFYNYSQYNLEKLANVETINIKEEFIDYIDSFSENIYDYLDSLNIEDKLNHFSDEELINLINDLNTQSSQDFLSSVIANIALNYDNLSISNVFGDEYLAFLTSVKVKLLNPDLDVTVSLEEYGEILSILKLSDSNIDSNFKIANMAFGEDKNKFERFLSDFNLNKLIITVSSSFFDKYSNLLSSVKNPNFLKAIISLPIYQDDDNLIIIILDADKSSSDFLLIDESESLIHKNDSYDYSFIDGEILPNIVNSYQNFTEYENGIILPISNLITRKTDFSQDIMDKYSEKDPVKRRVIKSDVDDLIAIQEKQSAFHQKQMMRHKSVSVESDGDSDYQNDLSFRIEDLMYKRKRQPLENLLYKHEKKLIDEDVKFVNLSEIADLKSINQKNDKDTILIAACKQCGSKLVYYNHDVETIDKDDVYIEIDNISSDVLKQYLYVYLNSFNGLDEIKYFSKKTNLITPEQLGFVKIPILNITTQFELVDAVRESEEFFKSIELLKKDFQSNILDYKHVIDSINELRGNYEFNRGEVKVSRSMRHAYSGLIWPLAVSYLYATKGGFESVERKDNYLVLFEFIAAFNFIILLSGLPDNVYQKYKWDIWDARNKNIYKDMTFGKWVRLSENIAQVYRNNNFTSKLEEELFNKISSNKILKILNKTKDFRNDESHGSHSNKYEADKVLDELNIYLEDIFDILEVYSNYKLIYVVSNNDLNHRVILLNGPCAPPIYERITFDEKLENEHLYLFNPRNNKKLLIKDNFMKFIHLDDERKHWALFLYDSCDYHEYNATYKCYQSKEEPLKCNIYDFIEDIIG